MAEVKQFRAPLVSAEKADLFGKVYEAECKAEQEKGTALEPATVAAIVRRLMNCTVEELAALAAQHEDTGRVKFMLHYVECTKTKTRAKVWYSRGNRHDGRDCVTLYEKSGYENNLRKVFPELYKNDTDSMTDYFEEDRVTIFADSPLFGAAVAAWERVQEKRR